MLYKTLQCVPSLYNTCKTLPDFTMLFNTFSRLYVTLQSFAQLNKNTKYIKLYKTFVLSHFPNSSQTLQHFTELHNTVQHFTTLYTRLHNFTKLDKTLQQLTKLYVTIQHYTNLYTTLQTLQYFTDYTQLKISLHNFTKLYTNNSTTVHKTQQKCLQL